MAKTDEPIAQLATRIPKELHRRLKLHCVTHEIAVQDFVTQAIEEKLGRKSTVSRLGASGMRTLPLTPMAGRVDEPSREVGGLSHADAAPPKPVALVATTVPDGGGREPCCRSACG